MLAVVPLSLHRWVSIVDLARFLDEVYLSDRLGLSAAYVAELRRAAWQLGNPELSALSKSALADFMRRFLENSATANNKRRMILTLWRAAYEEGLAPPPLAPKRLPEPEDVPTAWTAEEVGRLIWTAGLWPGDYRGIPAARWWQALFATAYWTGGRIGALLASLWSEYSAAGLTVRGRAQKNRRGQLYKLPPHCREKLDRLPRIERLIWPWPHCRRWFFNRARAIIERAGLDAPKTGRQLFHRLRRTNISYCAAVDLGLAQRQAGHASAATTLRHYVAPAICCQLSAADVLPVPAY